ncbi:MAG: flavin reductase family protein [Ruminococcaceae bacterium]|nr:flavin reductase family protein [Oscillospiraceae bacterium]
MSKFTEITPADITANPFSMIGDQWMLITAEKEGRVNAMTASWGGVGVLWGKKVAYIFIRPQRFTKEFVDASATLSLCFMPESQRANLKYFGSVSGRDEDKVSKTGLTVCHDGGTPYFGESDCVMICRKLYSQTLDPAGFVDQSIDAACYGAKDYHEVYVCEIEKVLKA